MTNSIDKILKRGIILENTDARSKDLQAMVKILKFMLVDYRKTMRIIPGIISD